MSKWFDFEVKMILFWGKNDSILRSKWLDSVLKMIGKSWARHLTYHSNESLRTYPTNSPYFSLRGPAVALDTPSAEGASFYRGEKVHNNYPMGLIISTSWRVAPRKQIPNGDMDFSKKVSKVTDFTW